MPRGRRGRSEEIRIPAVARRARTRSPDAARRAPLPPRPRAISCVVWLRIYYAAMGAPAETARAALDAHVRNIINWHFDPATGSPFWLDYASRLGWDPRKEVGGFSDLSRFPAFEDEWLRGGPVQRWIPKG